MIIGGFLIPAGIIFAISWWAGLPIEVIVGASIFGSCASWLLYTLLKTKKENALLRVEQHPQLGEVNFYQSRWASSFLLNPKAKVTVDGDTPDIRSVHVQTFKGIMERLPELCSAAIEECRVVMRGMECRTAEVSEFVLSSILLFDANEGDFTLFFDGPDDVAPWGMSVDFEAYKAARAEWIH